MFVTSVAPSTVKPDHYIHSQEHIWSRPNVSFKGSLSFQTESGLRDTVDLLQQHAIQVDSATYASLLRGCGNLKTLTEGSRIHDHINKMGLQQDVFLGNHLIEMYAKCGSIITARSVFDAMHRRNVFSWTIMIAAYAQHGDCRNAFLLFEKMKREEIQPNNITFISVLGACSSATALPRAKSIHASAVDAGYESNVLVGTTLINTYGKCGSVEDARWVFDSLHERNIVSWNAMIEAYAQHGHNVEMFQLFQKMHHDGIKPNKVTFISILGACSSLDAIEQGKSIHAGIVEWGYESDVVVGSALINLYGKSENLGDARRVFNKMHQRNAVSWNSIISAYTQHGYGSHAIQLLLNLQLEGLKPDNVTFITVLGACSSLAALTQGKLIHACVVNCGLMLDTLVGTALVTMYGKCGSISDARNVFDHMHTQDLVAWNAMMAAYAQHGLGKEAFQLFSEMQHVSVKPNEVTFVSILSACSRAGLVDEGLCCFVYMSEDYAITPSEEHYGCMIDLFGRAGLLEAAEELIKEGPSQHNVVLWETLLGACQVHGDVGRGKRAAKRVIELNPKDSAPYILLSNIYAADGRWDEVAKVREAMMYNSMKKQPMINNHDFVLRHKLYPQEEEIHAELKRLSRQTDKSGYVSDTMLVLDDVEDLEEHLFHYHDEKSAMASGRISTLLAAPLGMI